MAFVHLHTHTQYSLLDGSNKITEYVQRVKELGMNAAAITDHGAMYGVIYFYNAALAAGIKPILGCEVYVAPNSRFDKELTGGEDRYYHLILLAENNKGYANLIKIVSRGFTEGYYYKPRVDMEVLNEFHEGIICLSACLQGEVQRYIQKGFYEEAKKAAIKYRDCFGAGNYYLELQDHGIPEQKTVNAALVRMSNELDIPLVATNDIHYTYAEDAGPHDVLLCIQTGKKLSDEDRLRYEGGQFYVKSEEEMRALFPYAPQAIENTQTIADRCNVTITFGEYKLPKFDVPDGMSAWDYLNKLCMEGLAKKFPGYGQDMLDRLNSELGTIRQLGFVDYFLIVMDYIHYAKTHGISVGPGRGSAAGSIVSYVLDITEVDPIRYHLLFERFLNPERVSMPDIDVDFCPEGRQDVIDYVVQKYGKEKVVQIISFGTLLAKGVIRDVGRVMDLSYSFVDSIAKMIPADPKITLTKALEVNPELKTLYDTDETVKTLIDYGIRLEGLPRHSSTHAAGVVICPEAADEYVPLAGSGDAVTTQFEKTTLEELGLLKMDFLGLRNLTVIQDALRLIEENTGKKIDFSKMDYDDPAVFTFIGTGKTDGVFQIESAGMKGFMKELKPQNLEDVIAGISLFRPGPMDYIPKYIQGKNASGEITYDCPQLKLILEPTYGCIVYQEQVMQIVRELGGFSYGRSDLIRRAMVKKKPEEMEKYRKSFVYGNAEEGISGCISKGIDEAVAHKIYDGMMDFAQYAFNKSHAAAYAFVTYQTAYLKYYYPVEFMAALMTSVIDNGNKVAEYIYSSKKMGIKILPPDVNESVGGFSVQNEQIRYGLTCIKGIGHPVSEAIVADREEHGPYRDIKDFISRLSGKEVNKRTIESFIKAGAFDSFGCTRKQLMTVYSNLLDDITREKKSSMAGQMTLFDIAGEEEKDSFELRMPEVGEFDKNVKLAFEKEVLGTYISGHPLQADEEILRKNITNRTSDFALDDETKTTIVTDGEKVTVGGMIESKTIKYTKTGKTMAFISLEDLVGTVEVIIWPGDYEKNVQWITEDSKVLIQGRVSAEEEKDAKLICDRIIPFSKIPKKLWIKFKTKEAYLAEESRLLELLKDSDGNDKVAIYLETTKEIKTLPANYNVSADRELSDKLAAIYGETNVKIV